MKTSWLLLLLVSGCSTNRDKDNQTTIAHEFCYLTVGDKYNCRITARFHTYELCHYWQVSERYVWDDGKPKSPLELDAAYSDGRYQTRCFDEGQK